MDDKQLDKKLKKLRSSMDGIPSRTDKKLILSEIQSGKKRWNTSNLIIYAGSVACLLLLSLLLIQSGTFSFNNADDGFLLSSEDEEVVLLEYGSIGIVKQDFGNNYLFSSTSHNLIIENNVRGMSENAQPAVLEYHLGIRNNWGETIGSIKDFSPETNSYKNGVKVHLEPRKSLIEVMDEVLGYNLFERPVFYDGLPVIPSIRGGVYSLSFEIESDREYENSSPFLAESQRKRLLEEAGEVDVVLTIKDKEIARMYLNETEMLHIAPISDEGGYNEKE
ncbi:hypothetical protein [Ornithinibacillus halophilus]|uniref:Uncharacterized protein n=1 Tax=Ornithinibacillus halophilus TaxID=930117 RepID=A0A1M5NSA1_9BACI|nr:hypothetical protein [Ornithinibacillus halophilus]SHG92325.1 hypothetical protein SAMN05216225_10886 [Ornithinibacillus halophilus]